MAAVNHAVEVAPDPEPARRMRAELARQRDAGAPFGLAWEIALYAALYEIKGKDCADWRTAFLAMRDVWAEAYEGQRVARPLFLPDDSRVSVERFEAVA
jgi:hypothetical protein